MSDYQAGFVELRVVEMIDARELPEIFKGIEMASCMRKKPNIVNRIMIKDYGLPSEKMICVSCYVKLFQENEEECEKYQGIVRYHKLSIEGKENCEECGVNLVEKDDAGNCNYCKQLFLLKEEELFEKKSLHVENEW